MDRRTLFGGSVSSLLLPSIARSQALIRTSGNLPSPDLDRPFKVWKGIRPYRKTGLRLEFDEAAPNTLIHNYGHGGGGITLSWGCANWVRDQLAARAATISASVAVLGSGVSGLTTATVLRTAGYQVTVYTDKLWQGTTSAVAGGQFAPSLVRPPANVDLQTLVNAAYVEHSQRGASFGVSARDNFTHALAGDLDMVATANGTKPQPVSRLPFKNSNASGWKYQTLIANPTVLLPRLEADLRSAGTSFVVAPLSRGDVETLTQPVVVNCLGLGSGAIWKDEDLQGKKGILAVLPSQPKLHYLYSSIGYLFPRSDHLLVGGTIEDMPPNVLNADYSTTPNISDQQKAAFVVRLMKRVFNGDIPVPSWFSGADRIPEGMFKDANLDFGYVQTLSPGESEKTVAP